MSSGGNFWFDYRRLDYLNVFVQNEIVTGVEITLLEKECLGDLDPVALVF